MITTLRLSFLAWLIALASCAQTTPEPDYSGIRNLTYTIIQSAPTTAAASHVSVYPNPFVGMVIVGLSGPVPEHAIVYISDEKGKYRKRIDMKGQGSREVHIDFGNMPKGIYLCEVELTGKKQLYRLIKAN